MSTYFKSNRKEGTMYNVHPNAHFRFVRVFLVEIYQLASFAMCNLFGGKSGQMVRGGCNCKQKADLHILPQIGPIFSFFVESFSKTYLGVKILGGRH